MLALLIKYQVGQIVHDLSGPPCRAIETAKSLIWRVPNAVGKTNADIEPVRRSVASMPGEHYIRYQTSLLDLDTHE